METLIKIIADITGENVNDISSDDLLVDDLDFDSLMLFDLYQTVISEFHTSENISNPKQWSQKITVEDVWKLINNKTAENHISYDDSVTDIDMFPEVDSFQRFYESRKDSQPYFKLNQGIPTNHIKINGKDYINYSTYNYLGLNGNDKVLNSAINAIKRYGTSVSGSRLLSGEIEIHEELEKQISDLIGVDDSIVQVGGHSTNVNTIGNIVNKEDLIIHDELAHNSIVEGAILSHAMRRSFKHNNLNDLEKLLGRLRKNYRRTLIVVEGAYSMDGDLCPLPDLISIKKKYGCILMIDEAHSFGTVGKHGAGITEFYNSDPKDVDIIMGTLSKACASCGGFIAGDKKFINYLRFNSPGFVFSAGITPSNTAAALSAIKYFKKNNTPIKKLQSNSKIFLEGVKEIGFDTGDSHNSPIIPILIGDSNKANDISKKLFDNGINALPIVYPAVKEDEARIRFFMSSLITQEDIDKTLNVLNEIKENI